MGKRSATEKKSGELGKLFGELDLHLPTTFLQRNSLHTFEGAQVHELDVTPQVFDPELGGTGVPRRRCFESRSIDLGGWAVTGEDGKRLWKLSDFVCHANSKGAQVEYRQPVSFVVTPLSETPVSMTAMVRSTGSDLVVEIFSWDVAGAAAPRVVFSWRCWADAAHVVFAPGPAPVEKPPRAGQPPLT